MLCYEYVCVCKYGVDIIPFRVFKLNYCLRWVCALCVHIVYASSVENVWPWLVLHNTKKFSYESGLCFVHCHFTSAAIRQNWTFSSGKNCCFAAAALTEEWKERIKATIEHFIYCPRATLQKTKPLHTNGNNEKKEYATKSTTSGLA